MFAVTVLTMDKCIQREYETPVLVSDVLRDAGVIQAHPCGGLGVCGKCTVLVDGEKKLSCRTFIDADTTVALTGNIDTDVSTIDISATDDAIGTVIDIGTTTIAVNHYDRNNGQLIGSRGLLNAQAELGADVVSRIAYALTNGSGRLQELIQGQLQSLIVDSGRLVITGNTAMLHFLTGLDTAAMAAAPFSPESLFGEWREDFFQKGQSVYLPPCISAFVGADITCAILASGMLDKKNAFLLDIGTNGEMALWNGEVIYCCSVAAGPAFEGAGISCGMPAGTGAIESVFVEDGRLHYTVIGGGTPVGICGSGLIDAVACLLDLGIVDETGYMEKDFVFAGSEVTISREDIRQLQLAKAAVRAGVDTLLAECGLQADAIDNWYLAGGFGSCLRCESAVRIGLIPPEILKKANAIGNAAARGAAMLLLEEKNIAKAKAIAGAARLIELAECPFFSERYVDCMMFE